MTTELKDFLYELKNYADQTHILKDKYEKLPDNEQKLVMQHTPDAHLSPLTQDKLVFRWLGSMQSGLSNNEK
ncbi:hypothetical protein ACW2QC_05400 [Virgibacillus sp. FSP13]